MTYKVEVFERKIEDNKTWFVMTLEDAARLLAEVWARHDAPGHYIIAEGPGVWFCKKCRAVIRVQIQGYYPWMLRPITKRQHDNLIRKIYRAMREVAHEAA